VLPCPERVLLAGPRLLGGHPSDGSLDIREDCDPLWGRLSSRSRFQCLCEGGAFRIIGLLVKSQVSSDANPGLTILPPVASSSISDPSVNMVSPDRTLSASALAAASTSCSSSALRVSGFSGSVLPRMPEHSRVFGRWLSVLQLSPPPGLPAAG